MSQLKLAPASSSVVTRPGREALACWMLRQLPDYAGSEVTRSRERRILAKMDIVVDVGDVYDPAQLRFDHHQRGFFETADGIPGAAKGPEEATGRWKTRLSSSGLVYKHFGREIIQQLADTDPKSTELIWAEVYDRFIECIDAIDNGVEMCAVGTPRFKDCTGLSARVARLNPRWNEACDDEILQSRFEAASAMCGAEFLEVLSDVLESWLPARACVAEAMATREEVHSSGQVLRLHSGKLPWRSHVFDLERELHLEGHIKFLVYPEEDLFRVRAVPIEGRFFTNRLSLPEAWRGLRDDALVQASGIEGSCFAHVNGFIGGNYTLEGAIAMADASLRSSVA
ncbi:unnamed protein product [Symbiodinium natans]|uniref:Uncharacterized protein n=1 Tax=Symbiodinium natans TaxID=878477 RepID=A0A812NDE0_9DINO|nr:unnamed protein product [Symbiodinium natans]